MLLADRVCVVCVKYSPPKFNLGKLNKLLGQGSRRRKAEFSDTIHASGILTESCYAEYVCKTCQKKIKNGATVRSIQPQDVAYPNCESNCNPGNCLYDNILDILKNKKKSGQNGFFIFEEAELPKITEIMSSLMVHSFGKAKENEKFRMLVLFRTKTNVMCCNECWFLATKRPGSKNWQEPVHQCNPTDITRCTNVLEEESFAQSSVSDISSANENLNEALLEFDISGGSNENRQSIESFSTRKRLSDGNELETSLSKRLKESSCGQKFFYANDSTKLELTCTRSVDDDSGHKQRCNFRFGKKESWHNDTTCRQRFISEVLQLALSPKFQKDFFRVLSRKLEETNLSEEFTKQKSQMVSNVTVIQTSDIPRPILAPTRYTRVIDLTAEKIRGLAGNYCSRRELQSQIKTLRSTGIRPPPNLHITMSQERRLIHDQMETEDSGNSFIVRWTSSGLLDYLNRFVMQYCLIKSHINLD